jgi:hypothetical protein
MAQLLHAGVEAPGIFRPDGFSQSAPTLAGDTGISPISSLGKQKWDGR